MRYGVRSTAGSSRRWSLAVRAPALSSAGLPGGPPLTIHQQQTCEASPTSPVVRRTPHHAPTHQRTDGGTLKGPKAQATLGYGSHDLIPEKMRATADVTLHLSCCCCSPLRGLPASNRNRSTGGYASRDGDDDALSYPARAESRRRCGPTWPPHRRRDEPDRLCARRGVRQEKLPGRAVAVAHHRQQRNARKKSFGPAPPPPASQPAAGIQCLPFSPGAARASAPLAQLPAGGAKNKRAWWAVGSLQLGKSAAPWHTQPVPLRRRIRSCSGQTLSSLSSCPVLSRFFPCLLA